MCCDSRGQRRRRHSRALASGAALVRSKSAPTCNVPYTPQDRIRFRRDGYRWKALAVGVPRVPFSFTSDAIPWAERPVANRGPLTPLLQVDRWRLLADVPPGRPALRPASARIEEVLADAARVKEARRIAIDEVSKAGDVVGALRAHVDG